MVAARVADDGCRRVIIEVGAPRAGQQGRQPERAVRARRSGRRCRRVRRGRRHPLALPRARRRVRRAALARRRDLHRDGGRDPRAWRPADVPWYPTYPGVRPELAVHDSMPHLAVLAQEPVRLELAAIDVGSGNLSAYNPATRVFTRPTSVKRLPAFAVRGVHPVLPRERRAPVPRRLRAGPLRHVAAYLDLGWLDAPLVIKCFFSEHHAYGLPPVARSVEMTAELIDTVLAGSSARGWCSVTDAASGNWPVPRSRRRPRARRPRRLPPVGLARPDERSTDERRAGGTRGRSCGRIGVVALARRRRRLGMRSGRQQTVALALDVSAGTKRARLRRQGGRSWRSRRSRARRRALGSRRTGIATVRR